MLGFFIYNKEKGQVCRKRNAARGGNDALRLVVEPEWQGEGRGKVYSDVKETGESIRRAVPFCIAPSQELSGISQPVPIGKRVVSTASSILLVRAGLECARVNLLPVGLPFPGKLCEMMACLGES